MRLRTPALLTSLSLVLAFCARADVKLPTLLGDHMVVQRGLPVHMWGTGDPGESVSVVFRGETRSATADADGEWSVFLPPSQAGGPFEMTIAGKNKITLADVLVGDVWVGSGQSNMWWPVKETLNAQSEIAAANHPRIRLFTVPQKVSNIPLDDMEATAWRPCTPESVADFSATEYYFGRQLSESLGVPIGLIHASWGGTPADTWISYRGLSADASLMPVFATWAAMLDDADRKAARRQRELREWRETVEKAKAQGAPPPNFPWRGNDSGEWAPAALYNSMIAPLTHFPIRGAIWYQGETNASAERVPVYARLFQAMIQDWRRAWGIGDFPFFFVQLASFKTGPDAKWPELREAQASALGLANTGMAVAIDIGEPDNIHPKNKQEVGRRLALAARAVAYGEHLEYSGPLFRQATREGAALRVRFDHAGKALSAKGGALRTFEVAGSDRAFVPAESRIEGTTVLVSSPKIAEPMYVRYGWSDNPDCNLYNDAGLPASPFRSAE